MALIQKVVVQGFKTLRERTEIPLEPITVLVGANNSGKSNVLAAMQLIGMMVRNRKLTDAIRLMGGSEAILPRSTPNARLSLMVHGHLENYPFEYSVSSPTSEEPKGAESLRIGDPLNISSALQTNGNWQFGNSTMYGLDAGDMLYSLSLSGRSDAPPQARAIYETLRGIEVFNLSPAALREPAEVSTFAELRNDGQGIAGVLDQLDSAAPGVREAIDEEVRRAAPEVRRIVTPTRQKGFKIVAVAEQSGHVYDAPQASDGLLLLIALATIAHMARGPTLIGLEEIETGIHPRRLRSILDLLTRLSNKGVQFLLTTHSPILLNEFREFPERVLLCERHGEDTTVRRLSDTPDYETVISDVPLGDIWYSGVLGGVPHS
jgi:predicted ATPase